MPKAFKTHHKVSHPESDSVADAEIELSAALSLFPYMQHRLDHHNFFLTH